MSELTDDAFLGGDLEVLQPKKGYRAAMDAVLLAAAVGATPGDKVLDVGAGVGVVSLCLAKRLPNIKILGIEKQPALVDLAQQNITRNDLENVQIEEADLFDAPKEIDRNGFDWVVSNPPYYEAQRGRASPHVIRKEAHMQDETKGLEAWVEASVKFVRPLGRFGVIFPAEELHRLIRSLSGPLGDLKIFPLWPGTGKPARRVILVGTKGARGGVTLLPGLQLHAPPRRYSEAAERVLRGGEALVF
ncbi:MAG: methyltransferase domain-containing protein [Alphaproteobacteria bacterium]|nr:MAG: methyltransferase domain-containing protein [Alphaproteobacteria bacterium]